MMDFFPLLGGYLIGSVSAAVLLSRVLGFPDPRHGGSGNPGATNVFRLAGKKVALLTLLFDVAKVFIPMWVVAESGFGHYPVLLTGFATFVGHLYPLYHGFKGGKGVASFVGFLLYANPFAALIWFLAWLAILLLSRFVSLASILAPLPVIVVLVWDVAPSALTALVVLMSVMLVLRHVGNIRKMLKGTEDRIFS